MRVDVSVDRLESYGRGLDDVFEARLHVEIMLPITPGPKPLHEAPLAIIARALEGEIAALGWTSPERTAELERAITDLHAELTRSRGA